MNTKKLSLHKETVRQLTSEESNLVDGGGAGIQQKNATYGGDTNANCVDTSFTVGDTFCLKGEITTLPA